MLVQHRDPEVQEFCAALRAPLALESGPADEGKARVARVLVAVDDSEPGRWAVKVGERLARAIGAEVVLLNVINPVAATMPEMSITYEIDRIRGVMRREADELLSSARAEIDPALHVEPLVREGEAGHEIVATAAEWEASLVVMGTRARGRLASFFLGSTADEVVRHAPCPVVTVGHDPDDVPAPARPTSPAAAAVP